MQRRGRSFWGRVPPATRCPAGVKACGRGPGRQRWVVAGLCWTFCGGPPATPRSFYKPVAHQSLVLIVAPAELVGEEADRLLGELGEVDDAGDDKGGEQQRQQHAPRRGQRIVAPGLGAEAPSGFHVTGHFPVPRLQQPRDGAAAAAAPCPCLLPARLRGFSSPAAHPSGQCLQPRGGHPSVPPSTHPPAHPARAACQLRVLLLPPAPLPLPLGFFPSASSGASLAPALAFPRLPTLVQLQLLLPGGQWRGQGPQGPPAPSREQWLVLRW